MCRLFPIYISANDTQQSEICSDGAQRIWEKHGWEKVWNHFGLLLSEVLHGHGLPQTNKPEDQVLLLPLTSCGALYKSYNLSELYFSLLLWKWSGGYCIQWDHAGKMLSTKELPNKHQFPTLPVPHPHQTEVACFSFSSSCFWFFFFPTKQQLEEVLNQGPCWGISVPHLQAKYPALPSSGGFSRGGTPRQQAFGTWICLPAGSIWSP